MNMIKKHNMKKSLLKFDVTNKKTIYLVIVYVEANTRFSDLTGSRKNQPQLES